MHYRTGLPRQNAIPQCKSTLLPKPDLDPALQLLQSERLEQQPALEPQPEGKLEPEPEPEPELSPEELEARQARARRVSQLKAKMKVRSNPRLLFS